jgi:uncharacterized protein (TIGR04222 family)
MRKQRGTRSLAWVGLAMLALMMAGWLALAGTAAAQDPVVWEQYDVSLDVREDGSIHVTEDQVIRFNGTYRFGFADIPLDRIEDLSNVEITVDGQPAEYVSPDSFSRDDPGTFTAQTNFDVMNIDYAFTPTSYGDEVSVVLEYDVDGAIRVYEDEEVPNQQLWWIAISDLVTDVAPIEEATVSITLPEPVPAEQVVYIPDNPQTDGQTWTWTKTDMGQGDSFEVRLQFPPITGATVPSWQAADDEFRADQEEQEEKDAVAGVLLAIAGAVTFIGGGLGFFIAWFTRGRDPHVGAIADYIAEPPDGLSPGAAGTLIDEKVQVHDVLATVLDLARRGAIAINESGKEEGLFGLGAGFTHEFELKDPAVADRPFERKLLDVMFGVGAQPGKKTSMTGFRTNYTRDQKEIAEGMYDELVDNGYFAASPEASRQRWSALAFILPALAVGAAFVLMWLSGGSSGWIAFVIVAAVLVAIFGMAIAQNMPVKTMKGAEATAKWRAFRRYLDDIDQRENLQESRDIFEKYLPYAVAFGLEKSFVNKFAAAETPMPGWFEGGGFGTPGPYRPMRRGRRTVVIGNPWLGGYPGQGDSGGYSDIGRGGGGDAGGFPDLQDMSDSGGRTLQSGSDSFFDMLNTAARAFTASSGGRSGGFGGGGGFSGGGGGGGRGGDGGAGRGFG